MAHTREEYDFASFADSIHVLSPGEIVRGTVVKVDQDEVLVDVGYKSEGVISLREFSPVDDEPPISEGDEVEAVVVTLEDDEGRLVLSKRRVDAERAWISAEEAMESGEHVTGRVVKVVKGGLLVDIGTRAFLPASLVDVRKTDDLDEYVGKTIACKVIEVRRGRRSIILSRRAHLREQEKEKKIERLAEIEPGQVLTGTVVNTTDFGAFVDIGGVTGLVHISDLSFEHVEKTEDVIKTGDKIEVLVLGVDLDRARLSLGVRQLERSEWHEKVTAYPVGATVQGTVTEIEQYGLTVELEPEITGRVSRNDLTAYSAVYGTISEGDEISVEVSDIDEYERRIELMAPEEIREKAVKELERISATETEEGVVVEDVVTPPEEVAAGVDEAIVEAEEVKETAVAADEIAEETDEAVVEEDEVSAEETVATPEEDEIVGFPEAAAEEAGTDEDTAEPASLEDALEELKKIHGGRDKA